MGVAHICVTCGVQYPEAESPPAGCPICLDERQYVGRGGQRWTTMADLASEHRNRVEEEEPGLVGIGTEPGFAIGQRALLVRGREGNVLWDCVSLLDDDTADAVSALGGLRAICPSHPHFYGSCVEWAERFGAEVWIPEADAAWVVRPSPRVKVWSGATATPVAGVTLAVIGGHFPGASILHWPAGADGRGVLLTGDTVQVVSDRRWASFMYSYPNLIPLPAETVQAIAERVGAFRFDRLYGGWWGRVVDGDADRRVAESARRYVDALAGRLPDDRPQDT